MSFIAAIKRGCVMAEIQRQTVSCPVADMSGTVALKVAGGGRYKYRTWG